MYSSHVLTEGTILNNKYKIESVLGEGGFGIAYRAYDINIDETVAIKEYFPSTLGTRNVTNSKNITVTILSDKYQEMYDKGLLRFKEEASKLASFNKEPGIVSVKNYFEENNTGYMVMEFIEGITLKQYLKDKGGKMPYDEAIELLSPVMDSLSIIHKANIIHRDISPDNIMITEDGKAKLIDFGAARTFDNEEEKSMSVILKNGYAPIEQYSSNGNQRPATDVYALAATLYRMITGERPIESAARATAKITKINVSDVPENISFAINKAMKLDIKDRCKSIEEFKILLGKSRRSFLWLGALVVDAVAILILLLFYKSFSKEAQVVNTEALQLKNVTAYEEEKTEYIKEVYACDYAEIRSTRKKEYDTKIVAHCKTGDVLKCLNDNYEYLYIENQDGFKGYIDTCHTVSKEQYDEWIYLYNMVLSEAGADIYDFEAYDLPGGFKDYDGDGDYELFTVVYSGDSGLWYVSHDKATKIEDTIPNSFQVFEQGKTKIFASRHNTYNKMNTEYYYISDDTPQKLDTKGMLLDDSVAGRLFAVQGNIPGRFNWVSMSGNNDTAPIAGEGFWPIVALNGKVGEYASVEIPVEEFEKIYAESSKMKKRVDEMFDLYKSEIDFAGADTPVCFEVEDKKLMSVYYNDLGYFTLNYMVYYQLEPGTIITDYIRNNLPNQEPWRVIISYEEGTTVQNDFSDVTIAFMSMGLVGTSSGLLPVVLTSDFSNFKIRVGRQ